MPDAGDAYRAAGRAQVMAEPSRLEPAGPGVARRVLVLSPFPPSLDAPHGGARAIASAITALSIRHRVAVLYLRRPDEPLMDDALRARCDLVRDYRLGAASTEPRWRRRARVAWAVARGTPLWVARWASGEFAAGLSRTVVDWRPDVVQAEFHLMGQYFTALDAARSNAVLLLTEHEPSTVAGRSAPAWLSPVEALTWPRYERAVMRRANAVVVFTERDAESVAPLAGRTPVAVIPLGVAVPDAPLDPAGRPPTSVVFVGNFVHAPNVDAAEWLVREILPLLRARCPDVVLYLVGGSVPPQVRALAGEHVMVTGPVPDVTPYYDAAAVVLAPLRCGGGMRVKVLEALAAGKAVVATSLAVAGLSVVDHQEVRVADSAERFASATADLIEDVRIRAGLAERARAWACTHLDLRSRADAYGALYERLIAGVGATPAMRRRR